MSITLEQLSGYVERDLDADLARWFPDERPVRIDSTVRPVAPFLAKLPPEAARALSAFDDKVRTGTLTSLNDLGLDISANWTYGFDFTASDVEVLDTDYKTDIADDVWSLALDGGGNHYVMLTSGRIAVWNHEESAIEAHTQFDSLDVFLWSIVRLAALRDEILEGKDIAPDFEALAQPGALYLLKLWTEDD